MIQESPALFAGRYRRNEPRVWSYGSEEELRQIRAREGMGHVNLISPGRFQFMVYGAQARLLIERHGLTPGRPSAPKTLLRGLSPLSRPVRKDYPSTGTRPPREPGDRVSAEDRKIGANEAEAAMDEWIIATLGTPYAGGTIDRTVLLYEGGVALCEAKNTTRGTPTGDDRLNAKQREMYESGNVKVYHHFGPGDYEVWVCENGVEKCVEKSA